MSRRSILITAATEMEVKPILDQYLWNELTTDTWYLSQEHQELCLICTGVGATAMGVRTAFELAMRQPDLVMNMGIAGSYRTDLDLGACLFIGSEQFADLGVEEQDGSFRDLFEMELADRDSFPFQDGRLINPRIPDIPFLPVVHSITTNRASGSEESIRSLMQKYQPDIENMEGAGFFLACLLAEVPFMEIRSISNYVTPRDRATWATDLAIRNLNDIIIRMLQTLEVSGA